MTESGSIDIEGKKLVCSSKDLDKLSTPEGCHMQVITDKVHKLHEDDDGSSDGSDVENSFDDESLANEDLDLADKKTRERRRRREYISLVLNANRDPVKPGTKSRFMEFQEGVTEGGFECDTRNLEDSYVNIHKMYENLGSYKEYMTKNNFEEVSPGQVFKLKRVPGVQLPVKENDLVMYNCAFWSENSDQPFDSTWLRRTTISTHLGYDSILPGLRKLLLTCTKGELCEALISPDAAFGKLGVPPRIPANATIFCLLEVVKVVSQAKFYTLSLDSYDDKGGLQFADLFDASDEARRRGNHFYQQGQYRIALQRYKSAIRLLEGLTYKDEVEETQAQGLLIKLYNNCARTANAIGAPRLALAACKQARMINDLDPKTHWHRMTAWQKKGHLDRALGVARRAIQLFAHDAASAREFRKVADILLKKIQEGQRELNELHKLMGRALITSA